MLGGEKERCLPKDRHDGLKCRYDDLTDRYDDFDRRHDGLMIRNND